MKPNLFVIGAPKCGTTALVSYLATHPDIFVPPIKEPFFLARECRSVSIEQGIKSYDDYIALYSGASHQYALDGSTAYLRFSSAIRAALDMSSDAKFIILLRDPVRLSHSFHREQLWDQNEDVADFETAWGLQSRRRAGVALPKKCKHPFFLDYHATADIGVQIKRAFALIPPENRIALSLMQLANDPATTYQQIIAFLGLRSDTRTDFPVVNGAKAHRFPTLARLVLSPPRMLHTPVTAIRNHLRQQKPAWAEWAKSKLRKPSSDAALSKTFQNELEREFRPTRRLAEQMTGLNLSEPARQNARPTPKAPKTTTRSIHQ